jgi:RsiW-degrading membrane proteinase PrsW (M82 family)
MTTVCNAFIVAFLMLAMAFYRRNHKGDKKGLFCCLFVALIFAALSFFSK